MTKLWVPERRVIKPTRRAFIAGAASLLAAPHIAKAQLTMTGVGGGFGGAAASFTAFDPANKSANLVLSNSDRDIAGSGGAGNVRSLAGHTTGKYYCEMTSGTGTGAYVHGIGIANATYNMVSTVNLGIANSCGLWSGDATIYCNGAGIGTSDLYGNPAGQVVSMAVDLTNNRIWFRVSGGNWNNSASNDPATNTGGADMSSIATGLIYVQGLAGNGADGAFNFGQSAYAYTPPSGFGNW